MSNAILCHHFLAVHLLTFRYLLIDRETIWITECFRNFNHVGIANEVSLHVNRMSRLSVVMLNVAAREQASRPGEYTNLHQFAVTGFRRIYRQPPPSAA